MDRGENFAFSVIMLFSILCILHPEHLSSAGSLNSCILTSFYASIFGFLSWNSNSYVGQAQWQMYSSHFSFWPIIYLKSVIFCLGESKIWPFLRAVHLLRKGCPFLQRKGRGLSQTLPPCLECLIFCTHLPNDQINQGYSSSTDLLCL